MQVVRLGNLDIHFILTQDEVLLLEDLVKREEVNEVVIATAFLRARSYDPLQGKEASLIYSPRCNVDGADCSEMVEHFENPPIPVYIAGRGLQRLKTGEICGGAYLSTKVEVKVE